MKHTKGEWKIHSDKIQVIVGDIIYTPNRGTFYGNKMFESRANAKLIAAAPELLHAVESLMSIVPNELREKGTYQYALRAIKKATE